ncbi:hypothetical protein VOLCADRAFT_108021 [Volvox carteri f. nagariensis]|uniref:Ferredoxin thioredoxin reductase alpha chain domain-containing protein n=1 Tax=Volvox carteri f. nagariensis TaxID=3068 RepID=D8UHT4_VOLCA|nr:uncharacterized protein VOLCADRAFT_108021 [Volvox carteri f. nagariensis]EFJ40755.1 hypothetical protein VOLCADRAFT_108021 [Volvox carteri f. nagariensis]|eukprot:XP_002958221.1 hypothetical protein VOLCADRAFT_108021 [Volvox carteri f. nagariensis]
MSVGSVLPPVNEAISLLDVSFVNNEWHGTPATLRRSIQILVDHISVQSVQLSRVEDILNAFGNPSQHGGTVWSKLAAKADLSRLERLEAQMDGLLNDCAQMRTHQDDASLLVGKLREMEPRIEVQINHLRGDIKQSAAAHAHDDVASRLELLKDQMTSMEARLGLPYTQDTASGFDQYGGSRRHTGGFGSCVSPSKAVVSVPTGSVLDRILRLERRTDALAEMSTKAEALALAAASTRQEADAESTSRVKEAEKRLVARIQSVESTLEGKVSALSAQTGITISAELDKRLHGVYDHLDAQVQRLGGDLDRLSRDKIDLASLEHYSLRVSTLFEGVAQGLADEVATLVGQLRTEVAGTTRNAEDMRVKDKMLHDKVKAELDAMRQMSGQFKETITAMQEAIAASQNTRLLEETRGHVRQVMADTEQLQKAVKGLNTAVAGTSSALELQSHKLSQLSHKIGGVHHEVCAVKDTLYGGVASAAEGAAEQSGPPGTSLLSKLAFLERTIADLTASLNNKTDDVLTREMERRVATLARQQDVTAEGLRNLSATAFKRADEHASAIQRLTIAVSGNLEDRPTTTTVKHLVEAAAMEVRERCDQALAPLWDAVRILQSGIRDAAGELKAMGSHVTNLQQAQSDSRTKASNDRSSILATLRKPRIDLSWPPERERKLPALLAQQEYMNGGRGGRMSGRMTPSRIWTHAEVAAQGVHPGYQRDAVQMSKKIRALSSLPAQAMDDELGCLRTQFDSRLDSMASGIRQVVEQLEVHEKLQDRLTQLTTAIEEQLATQVSAWRTGNQQLRAELNRSVEVAAAALGTKVDALEAFYCKQSDEVKALSEMVASKASETALREVASTVASSLMRQELNDFREKELARWQAWLEDYRRSQDHLVTRSSLDSALDSATRQIKQDVDDVMTARVDELRRAFTSLRGEVDGRVRASTSRMEIAELRIQLGGGEAEELEAATAGIVTRRDVEDIVVAAMPQRAERAGLETRVRELGDQVADQTAALKLFRTEAVLRSEFTAEMARKVDLATYLAQGSARAAAANAAASASRAKLVIRCSGNGATSGAFHEGQKVKVVAAVKVYHAPKHHDGLDLNGMEGTLVKDVTHYKGKILSANFPFKVEFLLPGEGKPGKFQAHLGEDEIQAL